MVRQVAIAMFAVVVVTVVGMTEMHSGFKQAFGTGLVFGLLVLISPIVGR